MIPQPLLWADILTYLRWQFIYTETSHHRVRGRHLSWGRLPAEVTVDLSPKDTGELSCGVEDGLRPCGLWREVWSACTHSLFQECVWVQGCSPQVCVWVCECIHAFTHNWAPWWLRRLNGQIRPLTQLFSLMPKILILLWVTANGYNLKRETTMTYIWEDEQCFPHEGEAEGFSSVKCN